MFISYFFGLEDEGIKRFSKISTGYNHLKEKVKKVKIRPQILVGSPRAGTWQVPGGKSDFSKLVFDAGGHYVGSKNSSSSSVLLGLEDIVQSSTKIDIWLLNGPIKSTHELSLAEPRVNSLKLFEKVKIYNYNARLNFSGGNDFWETSLMRPDLLLKDLVLIFHPSLTLQGKLHWYKKLK